MIIKLNKTTIDLSKVDFIYLSDGEICFQQGSYIDKIYDADAEYRMNSMKGVDGFYEINGVLYNTRKMSAVRKNYGENYGIFIYFINLKRELKFKDEDSANKFYADMIFHIGEHFCVECHNTAINIKSISSLTEDGDKVSLIKFGGSQSIRMTFADSEAREDHMELLNKLNNIKQL